MMAVAVAAPLGGGLFWGGYKLTEQADTVIDTVSRRVNAIADELANAGVTTPAPGGDRGISLLRNLLPDPRTLLTSASDWFATTFGVLGNIALITFIGVFAATNPELYRRGALLLVPPR